MVFFVSPVDIKMQINASQEIKSRQWSLLLIYNIYRLINIMALLGLLWLDAYTRVNAVFYNYAVLIYLMYGLICLYIWHKRTFKFKQQVLFSGTIDTIVMVLFIYSIGYLQSGLGVLLSAPIAMLSILVPGRLAIFFAAVASCMLLAISSFQYTYGVPSHVNTFFSTGMYGVVFFATALTAWYFANLVRSSERLARQSSKELEGMRRLNEYIIGRLHYGVIYIDAEQQIKVINQAAKDFFNVKVRSEDLTLQGLSNQLYQKYRLFINQMKGKGSISAQAILDKPYLQVHFLATSILVKPAVLIILNDMVVIAQQAQQLKLAALGRFSASIAHELRNPLGIISHAVQLIREAGHFNEEDARLTELIMNNCSRMNAVIENVLNVSRRQQAKPELINLTQCLKQFRDDFCLINRCFIKLVIPQNKKQVVFFDKGHLEQILVILSDNAMQHGRDSSGEVHISIQIKHQNHHAVLMFCDSGPGIPRELRNEVFEPFFSTTPSGNGMGLFIAKDLCEINQTRLTYYEGLKGCCFAIVFNPNHEIEL